MSTTIKPVPQSTEPHIGIEFEFDYPDGVDVGERIAHLNAQLKEFGFTDFTVAFERVTNEAGYGRKSMGIELTWLTLQDPDTLPAFFNARIQRLLKIIKRSGAFVDWRCGLHVHLDARHTPPSDLKKKLLPHTQKLRSFTSKDRQAHPERYSPDGLWVRHRYETLEVRFMDANFNSQRINRYIRFILKTINA